MREKYTNVLDHPRKQKQIEVFGKDPETMDEFAQMCIDTINDKLANSSDDKNVHVVSLAMKITHSHHVSNSHSQPLLGVGNFSCSEENIPTGYPGWYGRVWVRYSDEVRGWGSDQFSPTLSYTGTGGAGGYDGMSTAISTAYYRSTIKQKKTMIRPACLSWDYRFYDMDFPGLDNEVLRLYNIEYAEYERLMEVYTVEMTWYKATGKNYPTHPTPPIEPSFSMQWIDDEQEAIDQAFFDTIVKDASRRNLNKSYDPA